MRRTASKLRKRAARPRARSRRPTFRRLLEGVADLRIAKGRKVVHLDLTADDRPSDSELAAMVVSRWGKLRAPSLRVGSTFVVGYNKDILASVFGTGDG